MSRQVFRVRTSTKPPKHKINDLKIKRKCNSKRSRATRRSKHSISICSSSPTLLVSRTNQETIVMVVCAWISITDCLSTTCHAIQRCFHDCNHLTTISATFRHHTRNISDLKISRGPQGKKRWNNPNVLQQPHSLEHHHARFIKRTFSLARRRLWRRRILLLIFEATSIPFLTSAHLYTYQPSIHRATTSLSPSATSIFCWARLRLS